MKEHIGRGQQEEDKGNDRRLQDQDQKVAPIVFEQFDIAHGEQGELPPGVAAPGLFEGSGRSGGVGMGGWTLGERLLNVLPVVWRGLKPGLRLCRNPRVLLVWLQSA